MKNKTNVKSVIIAVAIVWCVGLIGGESLATMKTIQPHAKLLHAIRMVESSGRINPPDGDGGRAIGQYQIHKIYWIDAIKHDPTIGGTYQDCRKRAYAEQIVLAYWARYAIPRRLGHVATDEDLARIHNGGLNGFKKASTVEYWGKVKKEMNNGR